METHTKTMWKCAVCGQILSSKQVANKHVKVKHPNSDQTVNNFLKVSIVVTDRVDNANVVVKKEKNVTKKNPKEKKKNFTFSTQLASAFKQTSLFEDFSLSKNSKDMAQTTAQEPTKKDNTSVSESGVSSKFNFEQTDDTTSYSKPVTVTDRDDLSRHGLKHPPGHTSASPALQTEHPGHNPGLTGHSLAVPPAFQYLMHNTTRPSQVTTPLGTMHGPSTSTAPSHVPEFTTRTLVISAQNLASFPQFEHIPAPMCEPLTSPICELLSSPMCDPLTSPMCNPLTSTNFEFPTPPTPTLSTSTTPTPPLPGLVPSSRSFLPPYKTRGHCGDINCTGCNRKPCGNCYNCEHKSQVR